MYLQMARLYAMQCMAHSPGSCLKSIELVRRETKVFDASCALLYSTLRCCRFVRVWDWVRRTRVAARHVPDEQPLCCALHPSGFMAALGSSEGLRTYYILRVSDASFFARL
jgi:hypothetical protein